MQQAVKVLHPKIVGFAYASIVAFWVNVFLSTAKQLSPDFKAGMTAVLGHSWVTQGAAVMLAWVVLGFILAKMSGDKTADKLPWTLTLNMAFASFALFVLYVGHFFHLW